MSPEKIDTVLPVSSSDIRRAILDYLARREYSQKDIAQKLKARAYPHDAIEKVIAELVQTGTISDARFTEHYIHARRSKGYGPKRIAMELEMHGIDDTVIAAALNITDNVWFVDVYQVWQKRFKGEYPNNPRHQAKHMRFLYGRGFTQEHIHSVLNHDKTNSSVDE